MKKVLFEHSIFLHQKVGGISNYIIKLNENLNNEKIDSKIVSLVSINSKIINSSNIINYIKFKKIPKFCRKLFFFINDLFFLIYIKFYKPDIVHFTYYNNKLSHYIKIPYILTVYDLISENLNYADTVFNKKDLIKNAKHIICISNFTKSQLIKHYNVLDKKISVIHLGVDQNNIQIQNNKKKYILFVGDRGRYKNFKKLLKAFSKSSYLTENFKIICFGGKKFTVQEKELFDDLKITDKLFQRFGDDNDLQALYEEASLFISVSLVEGFGLTTLEAMNFGCPVVCSDIPVFREILGDSCEFVNPNDETDIQNKIEKILKSKHEQDNLIKSRYQTVLKYSWKKCTKETSEIYKEILNEK